MAIRKMRFIPHAITAFILSATLMFPCAVKAAGIGEAVLLSGSGEPLFAQVDLMVGSDERIEDSCLSLVAPDPLQEDVSRFLTEANLSLKTDGKRQYVNISSLQPLNNSLARLRLQVKCPGMPGVIKTLAILPSAQEPRNGKAATEELALLLEQQKLLVASVLDLQQKFKQLQDELEKIKRQQAAAGPQGSGPMPAISANQPVAQQGSMFLQNESLIAALGLVLVLLALWLGLRHYTRIKLRSGADLKRGADTDLKPAGNVAAAPKINISPAAKQPSRANGHSPVLPPKGIAASNGVSHTSQPSPKTAKEKESEEDSMLEEAGLYAANGRMDKAAGILLEIIEHNPSRADAWTLLLSVYSALGRASEFEKTARNFLKYHKASPSWSGIQVLGRTLDRDNPLYADQHSHISAAPLLPDTLNLHRPIGDILVETGILSKREIQKYLDEFDPRQHGRFGGYLVARKAITIAQLDQALLQQQGVSAEAKPGDMPSLQDIESMLADFDPKKHGSVSKFLASRNVASPEQLGQMLRHTSNQGAAAKNPQAINTPALAKAIS